MSEGKMGKVEMHYTTERGDAHIFVDTYIGESVGYNTVPGEPFVRVWADNQTAVYQKHLVRKIVLKTL